MYPDASGHTLQSRARFFVGTLRDHLGLHMESWNMARKEKATCEQMELAVAPCAMRGTCPDLAPMLFIWVGHDGR